MTLVELLRFFLEDESEYSSITFFFISFWSTFQTKRSLCLDLFLTSVPRGKAHATSLDLTYSIIPHLWIRCRWYRLSSDRAMLQLLHRWTVETLTTPCLPSTVVLLRNVRSSYIITGTPFILSSCYTNFSIMPGTSVAGENKLFEPSSYPRLYSVVRFPQDSESSPMVISHFQSGQFPMFMKVSIRNKITV